MGRRKRRIGHLLITVFPFDIVLIRVPVSGSFITINDIFVWNYYVTKFGLLQKILI